MAIRYSDAMTNMLAGEFGLRQCINGSNITLFTGSQPTSANDTSGAAQPIISLTSSDGVYTPNVDAKWQATFSALSGSVDITSITVGGIQLLGGTVTGTSETELAAAAVVSINANSNNIGFKAESTGAVLVITAPFGSGDSLNAFQMVITTSGSITTTYNDSPSFNGSTYTVGVSSVNGLEFNVPVDGSGLPTPESVYYIAKKDGQTWSGKNGFGPATAQSDTIFSGITNNTSYTAGWGRICIDSLDTGLDATSGIDGYPRLDFSVGASNSDLIIQPTPVFYVNTTIGSEIETVINTFILKVKKNLG